MDHYNAPLSALRPVHRRKIKNPNRGSRDQLLRNAIGSALSWTLCVCVRPCGAPGETFRAASPTSLGERRSAVLVILPVLQFLCQVLITQVDSIHHYDIYTLLFENTISGMAWRGKYEGLYLTNGHERMKKGYWPEELSSWRRMEMCRCSDSSCPDCCLHRQKTNCSSLKNFHRVMTFHLQGNCRHMWWRSLLRV